MELETACLRLRRFRQEDQESCLRNWAADEAVYQHISRMPMTPGEPEDFLAGADGAYASPATYYWAIEQRDTQNVIGEIFVDDFSERNGWCEMDYKLGTAYWGRGYAAALGVAAAPVCRESGILPYRDALKKGRRLCLRPLPHILLLPNGKVGSNICLALRLPLLAAASNAV